MKQLFETPEVTLNRFTVEDVVTTPSITDPDTDTGEGGLPDVNPFG